MNNFTFGNATLPVLRDHLRRQRRRPRLRRHRGRAHPHDQLAPDRPRGPGMALPGAAGEPPHQPRLGRQGPAQGRRRHDPPRPLPRADAGGPGLQPPPHPALRPARREPGITGDQWIERADGSREQLAGRCRAEVGAATCSRCRRRAAGGTGNHKNSREEVGPEACRGLPLRAPWAYKSLRLISTLEIAVLRGPHIDRGVSREHRRSGNWRRSGNLG